MSTLIPRWRELSRCLDPVLSRFQVEVEATFNPALMMAHGGLMIVAGLVRRHFLEYEEVMRQ